MKRVFSALIAALLILSFVVCVYAYGSNKRFSVEKYIENLSQLQFSLLIGNLMLVWGADVFPMADFTTGGYKWKVIQPYTGESEILAFFDDVRWFFWRCIATGTLLARLAGEIVKNFELLLPWNATVDWDKKNNEPVEPSPAETEPPIIHLRLGDEESLREVPVW